MYTIADSGSLERGDVLYHSVLGFGTVSEVGEGSVELCWEAAGRHHPRRVGRDALQRAYLLCPQGGFFARSVHAPSALGRLLVHEPVEALGLLLADLRYPQRRRDLEDWLVRRNLLVDIAFEAWWASARRALQGDRRFQISKEWISLCQATAWPLASGACGDDLRVLAERFTRLNSPQRGQILAELDESMRLDEAARAWVKRCEELLRFADADGIVCIPSVRGEEPAAERLRRLLAAAFGEAWSAQRERELIAATGSKETTLDGWLRNDFFEQHCQLFHHRPFIWHIWDGRKRDGFHALVNYHKLAEGDGKGRKLLESLTYSYLGEWIARQRDGVRRDEAGAEDRLAAALELQKRLKAILEGEPPFDIFVRWKPLSQQPIGWEPDINDGVRLNIRPFMASDLPRAVCPAARKGAGVLRWKPNIKWGKDRGKEPQRPKDEYPWFWSFDPDNPDHAVDFMGGKDFDGNRWNGLHYTNKAKQAARDAAKEAEDA